MLPTAAALAGHEAPPLGLEAAYEWHEGAASGLVRGRARWLAADAPPSPYARLPASAEASLRAPVYALSRSAAGVQLGFETDSRAVAARWRTVGHSTAEVTVPLLLCGGADLYVYDGGGAAPRWQWLGDAMNVTVEGGEVAKNGTSYQLPIVSLPADSGTRAYLLNLPMYTEVLSFELGVLPGSSIAPLGSSAATPAGAVSAARPVVWYGTSITQGAAASRPGAAHTNAVSRGLGVEVYNYGFSGHGFMETSVGEYLAQINASVYVIDCLHNMNATLVTSNAEPLVRQLRAKRPETPIVLAEGPPYGRSWRGDIDGSRHNQLQRRAALRAAYERLQAAGVKGLHYGVPGDELFSGLPGAEAVAWQPTVAGTHPTDLGMAAMAASWIKTLPTVAPELAKAVDTLL